MNHTLKKLSDTKRQLSITMGAEQLTHAKDHAVKHLGRNLKVAGFRPGKAPRSVIEKQIDPTRLASETLDHAINDALSEALASEDIRPIDQPKVEIDEFKPYESLVFTAVIEVLPAITLGDYKSLKAKKELVTVSKEEIEEVVERMRVGMATKKEVKREAGDGDEVVIDFEGHDESGEVVAGTTGKDYALRLGSKSLIPGFEKGIVGRKASETFTLPLVFPADYHVDTLKNAKVAFTVTIKTVNEVQMAVIDDEFAAKVGPFTLVKEMKADIKKELTLQKEKTADDNYKDALLGELVKKSKVPLVEVLVTDQMDSVERDAMQNLMYRSITPEQYMESQGYKDRDEWREKEFRPSAENRVQAGLVLAELTKAEKIEATAAELEERLNKMKQESPNMAEQLDSPDARRDLSNRVLTEKALARLIQFNSN